jgi:hypothetical protein
LANHESKTAATASRSCSAVVLGKGLPRPRLDQLPELRHQRLERRGLEVGVGLGARRGLGVLEHLVEGTALDAQHDIAEDGDEAPIAVPGEALVLGPSGETENGLVVQPEIEHRIHHARHGGPRAERTETRKGA